MERYVIVRTPKLRTLAAPFDMGVGPSISGAESTSPGELDAPVVQSAELTRNEVLDAARDPRNAVVAHEMPVSLIAPFDVPAAAAAASAWGIAAVGAGTSAFTGQGVTVAVLDTGIDRTHPAFAGVALVEQDFSNSGNGDVQGHGTHCAGTIFGRDVNGTRIGIARGVTRALIGKVLDDAGNGSSDALFRAMLWATQNGANVVSMSLGFNFPGYAAQLVGRGYPAALATSMALEGYRSNLRAFDAIMGMMKAMAAFSASALVVAASGNDSHVELRPDFRIGASLPAAADDVIAVGAVEQVAGGLGIASFSNTFPALCAPGVNILSARRGGGLAAMSGTSMACPHVAGVAALWWEARRQSNGAANPKLVASALLDNARPQALLPSVQAADRGAGLLTAP